MNAYASLKRWVDRQWADVPFGYKALVLVAILPFLLVPILGRWWVWLSIAFALLWSTFVVWRGWLVGRAAAASSDGIYDKKTKFKLAREYWSSESATAALRRGRKKHG